MVEIDLQKFNKNRKLIKDLVTPKGVPSSKKKKGISEEGKVEIAGWVYNSRALGKIKFLLLKDISGLIQVTAVKGKVSEKIFSELDKITSESVVYVKGNVRASKQAPGGREIIPEELKVIAHAEALPIDVSDFSKTELPKRLDLRFLDLHRKRIQSIFHIQSTISMVFRDHFVKKGFLEFQPPSIISSSSEGGTELFPAKYFEKSAFLAQSPQLYKQMVACSMEKAMTITPVWRAEKHNTVRHLNECRQMDIEMAFADANVVMKEMEDVVKDIVKNVMENNKKELDLLGVKLKIPDVKYITFEQTKKLLEKKGVKVGKDDLNGEAERKLNELFPDTIVFVYDWPLVGKPFYIMPKDEKENSKLSEGFDAIYKGMEISSGGQRIHIPELLEKRLKAKGLKPKNFKSYIDSFRYGAPQHGGWSIGLERFTQVLLGLDNIREAVMFPRDRDRLVP